MASHSINDCLPHDILFSIFRCLDPYQVFNIRGTCKDWKKIIDENRTFWQTLVVERELSLDVVEPLLELYDEKSGSTLKEVSLNFAGIGEHKVFNFEELVKTLDKSKATPLYLSLSYLGVIKSSIIKSHPNELLGRLSKMERYGSHSRHPGIWPFTSRVRLLGEPGTDKGGQRGRKSSPLQVFWSETPAFNNSYFNINIDHIASLNPGNLRPSFLSVPLSRPNPFRVESCVSIPFKNIKAPGIHDQRQYQRRTVSSSIPKSASFRNQIRQRGDLSRLDENSTNYQAANLPS